MESAPVEVTPLARRRARAALRARIDILQGEIAYLWPTLLSTADCKADTYVANIKTSLIMIQATLHELDQSDADQVQS